MQFYCLGGRNLPLLILDLGLYVVDGVRGFNLQCNCFSCEGLYEDLHVAR